MRKITYTPEEVLTAIIEYYANTECEDFDETVTARFVDNDGSIELSIEVEETSSKKNKPKKLVN